MMVSVGAWAVIQILSHFKMHIWLYDGEMLWPTLYFNQWMFSLSCLVCTL